MITVRKLTPIGRFLVRHGLASLELIATIRKPFKDGELVFYDIRFNCINLQISLDANKYSVDDPAFKDLIMDMVHDYLLREFNLDFDFTANSSGVMLS